MSITPAAPRDLVVNQASAARFGLRGARHRAFSRAHRPVRVLTPEWRSRRIPGEVGRSQPIKPILHEGYLARAGLDVPKQRYHSQEVVMSVEQVSPRTEPGQIEPDMEAELGTPPTVQEGVADASTSSLACYFSKNGSVTWQWGLNNDNSYYKLNGDWKKTPYTKLTKFFTQTSTSDIMNAAAKAQSYYNLDGYSLVGIFAAESSSGYNYPVVVNSTEELFPAY